MQIIIFIEYEMCCFKVSNNRNSLTYRFANYLLYDVQSCIHWKSSWQSKKKMPKRKTLSIA